MKLYLLGGFLGSGKTTAIAQAVHILQKQGKTTGVVMNDQGEQLVDARYMQELTAVESVPGSCFCCNYERFEACIQALEEKDHPDILFAESVGSCTDLVATIIKPLLARGRGDLEPVLSVFADVRLLHSFLTMDKNIFHGNMNYVYEMQLEEADVIVVNKMDLVKEDKAEQIKKVIAGAWPGKKIVFQRSIEMDDVGEWLSVLEAMPSERDRRSLDIDYAIYAAGEAEMAWYDSELEIITFDKSADRVSYRMATAVNDLLVAEGHLIGHLKFFADSEKGSAKLSFTTLTAKDRTAGGMRWGTNKVRMVVNARVKADPEVVDNVIQKAIRAVKEQYVCLVLEHKKQVFRPGYPTPTYRIGGTDPERRSINY